jgi:hypothetical protein
MATQPQIRTLTDKSQFTDAVIMHSYFNVSISGTWTGTITVQRSFDAGSTWADIKSWTANDEEYGFEPERYIYYRIGIKATSAFTGQATVRLSQ